MDERILLTAAIELFLPAGCILFNRYIDHRAPERKNGETAIWVMYGVAYIVTGATGVLAMWWHVLPQEWWGALWVWVILAATFTPSGLVMWWGDKKRYSTSRKGENILRKLNGSDLHGDQA